MPCAVTNSIWPGAVKAGLIEYIPFPDALRGKYQCYTQADLSNLRASGCDHVFADVQTGVSKYMANLSVQMISTTLDFVGSTREFQPKTNSCRVNSHDHQEHCRFMLDAGNLLHDKPCMGVGIEPRPLKLNSMA